MAVKGRSCQSTLWADSHRCCAMHISTLRAGSRRSLRSPSRFALRTKPTLTITLQMAASGSQLHRGSPFWKAIHGADIVNGIGGDHNQSTVVLTTSKNRTTVSEFPVFRNATYSSIGVSHGSNGTKVTPGGEMFFTHAGTSAIPSPWATNCNSVDLSMISHTMFGWVSICRNPLHNASCRIGRACLG